MCFFSAMPYTPAQTLQLQSLGRTSSSSCLRAWITYTRRWSFTGTPGVSGHTKNYKDRR